jgi:hypothetical protein
MLMRLFLTISSELLLQRLDSNPVPIHLETIATAVLGSKSVSDMPFCYKETRKAIRDRIIEWADFDKTSVIFWLHGSAGTGKSTISHTMARYFKEDHNRLAASYFFKRGEKDRNGTIRFFATIAKELMKTIPMFRQELRAKLQSALGDDYTQYDLDAMSLENQFNNMILGPLKNIPNSTIILPKVVVIDALDECENATDIPTICELFTRLQILKNISLRVLMVSRDESTLLDAFKELGQQDIKNQSLSLDREYLENTHKDITEYLKFEFASIKSSFKITKNPEDPWPDSETQSRLILSATTPSPLFIYVATFCRFVGDRKSKTKKNPKTQLKLWLKDTSASQFDQTYLPILGQLLYQIGKEDESQLKDILSAIIFIENPLSASELAGLLEMEQFTVDLWLENLHAVVYTPEKGNNPEESDGPVHLYHKSFSDFIIGYKSKELPSFRIKDTESHSMLALKCIKRMKRKDLGLKQDICEIGVSSISAKDVDSILISHCVPADLQYACLSWVSHLVNSKQPVADEGEVHIFFKTHLLHWLEVLGLIGNTSSGVEKMRDLENLLIVSDTFITVGVYHSELIC